MLPTPLHPAIVHFPIVLMVFLPIVALVTLWVIRRGASPFRAWAVPVALAGALTLSAWAALATGESQEDAVSDAVGEAAVATHEEAAERFLALSGLVLVVMAGGLLRDRIGRTLRIAATVASLALVAAGIQVGHSGGQLVYPEGTMRGIAGTGGMTGAGERTGVEDQAGARGMKGTREQRTGEAEDRDD